MTSVLMEQLKETVGYIQQRYPGRPMAGIVLGSGLGNLVKEMNIEAEIPYHDIPHFPLSTVEGHQGKLIFGELGGRKIVCMAGRFHYYEGYQAAEVAYPIRAMKLLGIDTLLISNAAGGVNEQFRVGDLMVITDHISFFTANPLTGKNEPALGERFPDMSEPYRKNLIQKAREIAAQHAIPLKEGVYCGVTGPSFESRAEYRLIKLVGADAVGMSTVQEVIVAAHMKLPVFAMSVITDIGIREEENAITHDEVLQAARAAEPKLSLLFREMIAAL